MAAAESTSKRIPYFLITYLVLWIALFEFVLPINKILPKPSIVILSFGDLWKDYRLPVNFLSTVTGVYFSIAVSYFLIFFLKSILIKKDHLIIDFITSLNWFSRYLPGMVIGLFLIYWFPFSAWTTIVFITGVAFFSLASKFGTELNQLDRAYIDSAKSLGADSKAISNKIIWKSIQRNIADHILEMHGYLWGLAIIFEFIKGGSGLGGIFKQALNYNDLSALFSVSVITAVTVFAGFHAVNFIKTKFIHWN